MVERHQVAGSSMPHHRPPRWRPTRQKPLQYPIRSRWRTWMPWAAMALVLLAAAIWAALRPNQPENGLVTRLHVPPPSGMVFGSLQSVIGAPAIAISPGGKLLAFAAAERSGKRQLWIRPLDSVNARPLAGTEDAVSAFWSPDNRSLAFFARGKLKRIDVTSGNVQTICDAPNGRGGAWNQEEVILFASSVGSGFSQVAASGGTPTPATQLDSKKKYWTHRYPSFLPDGRHFLYLARSSVYENNGIYLGSLDGEAPRKVVDAVDALQPAYASGFLLYVVNRGTLVAQPFDAKRMRTTGNPLPIAEGVATSEGYGYAAYSVSANGVLVYSPLIIGDSDLTWFDRKGQRLGKAGPTAAYVTVMLSPDGKHIATDPFDLQVGARDIMLMDLTDPTHEVLSRLTFTPHDEFFPTWSSDGKYVVYTCNGTEISRLPDICRKPATGARQQEVYIEGSIRSRQWEDQNGNKRTSYEIVANVMKMLGSRADSERPAGRAGASVVL